jgi:predicted transcriptional regulator
MTMDEFTLKLYYEKRSKGFECKMLPVSMNIFNKASERKLRFTEDARKLDSKYADLQKSISNATDVALQDGSVANITPNMILKAEAKMHEYKRLEHNYNIDTVRLIVDRKDFEEGWKAMVDGKNDSEFWLDQDLVAIAKFVASFREAAGI